MEATQMMMRCRDCRSRFFRKFWSMKCSVRARQQGRASFANFCNFKSSCPALCEAAELTSTNYDFQVTLSRRSTHPALQPFFCLKSRINHRNAYLTHIRRHKQATSQAATASKHNKDHTTGHDKCSWWSRSSRANCGCPFRISATHCFYDRYFARKGVPISSPTRVLHLAPCLFG